MIKTEIHFAPDSDPMRSSIGIVNSNDIQNEGSASSTVVSHGSVVENMNDNVDENDNCEQCNDKQQEILMYLQGDPNILLWHLRMLALQQNGFMLLRKQAWPLLLAPKSIVMETTGTSTSMSCSSSVVVAMTQSNLILLQYKVAHAMQWNLSNYTICTSPTSSHTTGTSRHSTFSHSTFSSSKTTVIHCTAGATRASIKPTPSLVLWQDQATTITTKPTNSTTTQDTLLLIITTVLRRTPHKSLYYLDD